VDWIGAEAVGVPGQRTFRLLVSAGGRYAHLWLEKEQLQALAEAIGRLLLEIDASQGKDLRPERNIDSPPKPGDFPSEPEIDFHVGALTLRYVSDRDRIALDASDSGAEEDAAPEFRCLATKNQMEALQNASLEVISAGRPRCPLCGTPLPAAGIPHFCPPTNGHQKLTDEA
jgi:uncharacterized repeat protein (TIGR03847 family)